MFSKTIIVPPGGKEPVPYEKTVIEKRAPTDDSVRIYAEFKEKAFASILDTIKTDNNVLSVAAITFQDFESFGAKCRYSVTLNGLKIEKTIPIKDFILKNPEVDMPAKQQVLREILKDVSEEIATRVCEEMFKEL